MLDIKEFQRAITRIDELTDQNSKDKALLGNYEAELEKFKDIPGLYAAFNVEIDKIVKNNTERESLQNYVREHQASIGREIKEYLILLRDEADSYLKGSNKEVSLLTTVVSEIKNCIHEIDTLLPIIQHLHAKNASEKTTASTNTEPNVFVGVEQILCADYEFSEYTLHNKMGFSLKSFFNDKASEIRQVLEHYDNDYQATISYLQTKHGLCNGQVIALKTFVSLCVETFGVKKPLYSRLGWKNNSRRN